MSSFIVLLMRVKVNRLIEWSIPLNAYPELDENSIQSVDFAIGLFRYGSPENTKSVITKSLAQSSARSIRQDTYGKTVFIGKIQFRAPKTAGCFVFRLFDKSSSDCVTDTLGTSVRFFNELYDGDVTLMLTRSYDGFVVSNLLPVPQFLILECLGGQVST